MSKGINHNIPTTWRWARGDERERGREAQKEADGMAVKTVEQLLSKCVLMFGWLLCLSVFHSFCVCLSLYLCLHPSVRQSLFLQLYLSIYLSIYVLISLMKEILIPTHRGSCLCVQIDFCRPVAMESSTWLNMKTKRKDNSHSSVQLQKSVTYVS